MPQLFDIPAKPESLDSVADLLSKIQGFEGALYLRGQSDSSWGLLPSIARPYTHAGKKLNGFNSDQERDLLHRFRRHTYEHRNRVLNEWEALFLARHHGLPVRLLDWSTNPLVALFWACLHSDGAKTDGAIWWFKRREANKPKHLDVFKEEQPLQVAGIRLIFPYYPTQRMTAQSGVFTIHGEPNRDPKELPSNAYPEADCDIESGGVYFISAHKKGGILIELDRLGINSRTLLPELDGIAAGLWQSELLRS
jgi:hypothetical protein